MKVAITGAAGHLGAALARTLLERGSSVRALVHRDARGLQGLPVERVDGDLASVESLCRAFAGADLVFHAAARISISRARSRELFATNAGGTRNVIAACRAAGVRRLVHFSSIEALAPFPLSSPIDEQRPLVDSPARLPYSASKAEGERLVRAAASEGLDAIILNPTAIVGPFDYKPSLLGKALIAIVRGAIPALVDGGFDWVDVRDVAEGAVRAAETAPSGARYLLGGRWASLVELAALACEATGARPPGFIVPRALARAWAPVSTAFSRIAGRVPLFTSYTLETLHGNPRVSHALAERDLGYRPRDLGQTIRDTCRWFAENGFLDGVEVR